MNLYLIQKYSEGCLMINADQDTWHQLDGEYIYFEPGEEAEVLRGTCIMMGNSVHFREIANRHFGLDIGERCYVLSKHEPEVKRISTHTRLVRLQYTSIFERTHENLSFT